MSPTFAVYLDLVLIIEKTIDSKTNKIKYENMNITMELFCVFFLSCITFGKASSLMGEDNGNIFANPNLRGLQGICSDTGNNNGGDCSNTPTICGSLPNGNGVSCRCENPRPSDAPPLPVEYCYDSITYNQSDCGGCSGSCAGRNNCLNLDFYCAEDRVVCCAVLAKTHAEE